MSPTSGPPGPPGPYGAPGPPPYSGWSPPPAPPRNGMGVAALVTGAIAFLLSLTLFLFFVAGPLGLVAAVLGFVALGRVRRGEATNRGFSIAGIVLGILAMLVSAGILIAAIVGLRVLGDVQQEAVPSGQPVPTSDAAAEGWSELAVQPGTDDTVDGALAIAVWALPGIGRTDWPSDRVVTVAGNLAAAVQGGADAQQAVDALAAEGVTGVTADVFANLAVQAYCTPEVATSFQQEIASNALGTGS